MHKPFFFRVKDETGFGERCELRTIAGSSVCGADHVLVDVGSFGSTSG